MQLVLNITRKAPWANKLHCRRISFQISSKMRKRETLNLWWKSMTAFQNIHMKSIQNSDDKQSICVPAFNQVNMSVCPVCTWLLVCLRNQYAVFPTSTLSQERKTRRSEAESCAPYLQLLKYQIFKNSVHGSSPNQHYQAAIQFKYWDTVSSYRAYIPDVINSTHKLVVVGGNKRLPHIISAASLTLVICVLSVMTWKVKQGWSIFPASNERKCMLWIFPIETFHKLNDGDKQPHVWYIYIYIYIYISQMVWWTSKSSQRVPHIEAVLAM